MTEFLQLCFAGLALGARYALVALGFVIIYRHDSRLVDIATAHAREGVEPEPFTWRLGTDGTIPAMRGFSSLTICCTDEFGRVPDYHRHSDTPDRIDPVSVERAVALAQAVVTQIDSALVPSLLPSLER